MSCGAGHGGGSDLMLLWLWHRPVAVVPIQPLAREPPYAAGGTLKRQEIKIKIKKKNEHLAILIEQLDRVILCLSNLVIKKRHGEFPSWRSG